MKRRKAKMKNRVMGLYLRIRKRFFPHYAMMSKSLDREMGCTWGMAEQRAFLAAGAGEEVIFKKVPARKCPVCKKRKEAQHEANKRSNP